MSLEYLTPREERDEIKSSSGNSRINETVEFG
jgi:hypothetical protein